MGQFDVSIIAVPSAMAAYLAMATIISVLDIAQQMLTSQGVCYLSFGPGTTMR